VNDEGEEAPPPIIPPIPPPPPPAPAPAPAPAGLRLAFRYACWAVDSRLLVNQYSVRPAGTFSENQPIMSGRNFRMACVDWADESPSAGGGLIRRWVTAWETTSRTGRMR